MTPSSLAADAQVFEIPLFDGKTYTSVRSGLEMRSSDDYTWRGFIQDKNDSLDVILTFKSGMFWPHLFARRCL